MSYTTDPNDSSKEGHAVHNFLLARIAEDERRIYEADSKGEYRAAWITFRRRDGSMDYTTIAADHRNGYWAAGGATYQQEPGRVEISEPIFDARRVLAECEAKRRIVELHNQWHECTFGPGSEAAGAVQKDEFCPTLRLLALPYIDHPDYREEWRL